ncbi:MAG: hypothetical protein IPO95_08730 [Rhodanobacteraceae bacterium]|nr:hypothetical protein [Rhodanobacteraceae bacterium]
MDGTDAFIAKWQGVAASELSTSQSFLIDLCELLGVERPHATPEQDYMFERPITFRHGDGSTSAGRIDLYRRGCLVLESKKLRGIAPGKGFDDALLRARSQAEAMHAHCRRARGDPRSWSWSMSASASSCTPSSRVRVRPTRRSRTRARTASRSPTWRSRNCASACAGFSPRRCRSTRVANPPE